MEVDLYQIASYVIAIVIGVVGSYFGVFKDKVKEFKTLAELVVEAVEDGEITPDELRGIAIAARTLLDRE